MTEKKPVKPRSDEKKLRAHLRRASAKAKRTPAQDKAALLFKVRILYDEQAMRIQAESRINKPEEVEVKLHEADKVLIEHQVKELDAFEHEAELDLLAQLRTNPAYLDILSRRPDYKGIGPRMAGVILAEFDITMASTVSKLWTYAGLNTVTAFYCKRCGSRLGTKIQKPYVLPRSWKTDMYLPGAHPLLKTRKCVFNDKNTLPDDEIRVGKGSPRPIPKQRLPYNKWLRTKLLGVMGPNLIKANSPLRKFYDDYKHRKASANWGNDDGHRHAAAIRYMVKMTLQQIWEEWRELEGLEVRPPYHEEYLDKVHG